MVHSDDSDTVHSIPKREINPGAFPPGTRNVSLSYARHAIPFLRGSEMYRVHVSASCKILTRCRVFERISFGPDVAMLRREINKTPDEKAAI